MLNIETKYTIKWLRTQIQVSKKFYNQTTNNYKEEIASKILNPVT